MMKEKKDIRHLLLKFGVAVAISFAGFLYSRLRINRIKPSNSSSSSSGKELNAGGRERADDVHASPTKAIRCIVASTASDRYEEGCIPKVRIDNATASPSPSSAYSGERDGFLLPEFNELVMEFNLAENIGISPRKEVETPKSDSNTPKALWSAEMEILRKEIENLTDKIRFHQERERDLQVQLLQYRGLKEQEAAVMELQNRLKINNVEAKLFTLKIESLQADKRRLEAQVVDHAKVSVELEAAKGKIKLLKKKLRSDAEQNKEQILILKQRVAKLLDEEHKSIRSNSDIQQKLQRLMELETEASLLKKSNHRLQMENSELSRRLESAQILANSILEDPEAEELKRTNDRLQEENENLTNEIERLQTDRCADVEELVYLRWINACLRYELRNFQPPTGKTVARDLSKTLSTESEKKAKELILEYAKTEGLVEEKNVNFMDFDSDQWSSSQASYVTDSGEYEDTLNDNSSTNRSLTSSKSKFLSKLRRLLRGKDTHQQSHDSSTEKNVGEDSGGTPSDSPWFSAGVSPSIDSGTNGPSNRLSNIPRSSPGSLDVQRVRSFKMEDVKEFDHTRRNSDCSTSYGYKRVILGGESASESPVENQDPDAIGRTELVKYAGALLDSRGNTPKGHRKSVSDIF
ncbi:hypothetical protein RJ641_019927 [Dillenia turbinata]|uniref:Protein CHUP1, chloroplastic n=1 Tax=Dillenia turbinata TaxID=194707 RepID=A0AAN8UFX5_9MAGN